MKIGITCYPTYGGSGVVATELGKTLAARGHEVHFITSAMPYRLNEGAERIYYHEVDAMHYPVFEHTPYSLALSSQMVYVAGNVGLDLLHVHYAVPHATSAILARDILAKRMYLPVITTLHGTDATVVGNDRSYLPITEYSINQSDFVTAVSDYLRLATLREFVVTRDIHVIPNSVDLEVFQKRPCSAMRGRIGPRGEKVLMHVSNFRPVKRIPDVIRVFNLVQRQTAARLAMVGDGPTRPLAERMALDLGLGPDKVFFPGKVEVTADVLACADLLLLPSDAESFGLVALEAMACQVPVVGTMAGGLPEVVAHGESGLLFPVGNIDAMAAGAMKILTDPDLAARMGKAGRKRAETLFSPDRVVPMYEALYHKAIELKERRP